MKIFAVKLLVLLSFVNAHAGETKSNCAHEKAASNAARVLAMVQVTPEKGSGETAERSGCCSHHSGVCGCSATGRAVCCDGTLSPSCGCN